MLNNPPDDEVDDPFLSSAGYDNLGAVVLLAFSRHITNLTLVSQLMNRNFSMEIGH